MIDYEKNNNHQNFPSSSSPDLLLAINGAAVINKRKRRPAGTPDPDADVVSLSPRTLLESDRYVCEICNQGFQRDQNLQMHRRRHKVPWKLLKREKKDEEVRKRVYVCPEPTCLHHDPCHALGDLVGIKKHFRRKHSVIKQWVCERCSKGYAVQSDYKAHLKTCGSRGHSCDCGRVFSRSPQASHQQSLAFASSAPFENLQLQLSIGMTKTQVKRNEKGESSLTMERAIEEARRAEKMRQEARRQIEMAQVDFEKAKNIRKEAKAELEKAHVVREEAIKRINATMLEITCHSCKDLFQLPVMADESTSSLVTCYVSSATTEGEAE
ncbi:hypothetical protein YC2023_096497 [Brassica napus]